MPAISVPSFSFEGAVGMTAGHSDNKEPGRENDRANLGFVRNPGGPHDQPTTYLPTGQNL